MVRLKFSIQLAYQVLDRTCDFIFNIQPACTDRQRVIVESLAISQPLAFQTLIHASEGGRYLRLQAQTGPLEVLYQGVVEIAHHMEDPAALREMPVSDLPLDALIYVYPSRYCQSDKLRALANFEFGAMLPGY